MSKSRVSVNGVACGLLTLLLACSGKSDEKQPPSTQVDEKQPPSTQVDEKQPPSTQVNDQHGWVVTSSVDAMTDVETKQACSDAESGERLCILFLHEAMYSVLDIRAAGSETLASDKYPEMRVDKNEARQGTGKLIAIFREIGDDTRERELVPEHRGSRSVIRQQVGAARESYANPSGLYHQLVHGQNLLVRYYVRDGVKKDAIFSLAGANEAISSVMPDSLRP